MLQAFSSHVLHSGGPSSGNNLRTDRNGCWSKKKFLPRESREVWYSSMSILPGIPVFDSLCFPNSAHLSSRQFFRQLFGIYSFLSLEGENSSIFRAAFGSDSFRFFSNANYTFTIWKIKNFYQFHQNYIIKNSHSDKPFSSKSLIRIVYDILDAKFW